MPTNIATHMFQPGPKIAAMQAPMKAPASALAIRSPNRKYGRVSISTSPPLLIDAMPATPGPASLPEARRRPPRARRARSAQGSSSASLARAARCRTAALASPASSWNATSASRIARSPGCAAVAFSSTSETRRDLAPPSAAPPRRRRQSERTPDRGPPRERGRRFASSDRPSRTRASPRT